MGNRNLHKASKAKNDEFYTRLETIEREVMHYREHFKGKTVYLNCDDPRESNFFKYFSYNFRKLKLKRLIASCYKSQDYNLFSMHDVTEKAVWLEYTGEKDDGRVPTAEAIGVNCFKGDGDFRSEESIELLKQADIVVTNPPFSLFREYMTQLIEYDKKFLILGNFNAITYKEIFPLIKENKVWTGVSPRSMEFFLPNGSTKVVNACWYTNLPHKKRNQKMILFREYTPEKYPKYDNYDAINVDKVADIPKDYKGVMGVPITFVEKHNPEQFEILGSTQRGCHDKVSDTKKYDDYWEVRQNGERTGSSGGKTNENANLLQNDGRRNYFINKEGRIIQSAYHRIFIRFRREEK